MLEMKKKIQEGSVWLVYYHKIFPKKKAEESQSLLKMIDEVISGLSSLVNYKFLLPFLTHQHLLMSVFIVYEFRKS